MERNGGVNRRQGDEVTGSGKVETRHRAIPILVIALSIIVACAPSTQTLVPTSGSISHFATCADLDTAWAAADWSAVLQVLDQLEAAGFTCSESSLAPKRYAAHINYAVVLESDSEIEAAIEQYRAAWSVNDRGQEALDALARLNALPDPTPYSCNPGELAPYISSSASPEAFVSVEGDQLTVDGQPFFIRGVNYYPRHAPWDRFLTESDLAEIAKELDLIAAAGFNTLRIFLWYDPLFTCAPEDAIPNPEIFAKLDAFIALVSERGLRLIVTFNDLPDLVFRPLYTDWAHYDAQTAFIVRRYRDESAVLAWDLRNEGDLDYGAQDGREGRFERETVLAWLTHAAELVREKDDRHLLTAGWWGDATETSEVVDVFSFHHWTGATELVSRIEALKEKNTKPIVVEEVGFPSWGENGEASQAQMLGEVIGAAESNGVAGWLVWTAFDFMPADEQPTSPEYTLGLWRVDLTAKLALEVLPIETASLP
jgi:hypothetical protein